MPEGTPEYWRLQRMECLERILRKRLRKTQDKCADIEDQIRTNRRAMTRVREGLPAGSPIGPST